MQISEPARAHPQALMLVEEISHRVVNEYTHAIAGIRLAAAEISSAEARDALITAATSLRQFAELHRALQAPTTGGSADLGEYLERLCVATTVANLNPRGVRLTLHAETLLLPAQRCWRVALIVSELITNAVRHGLQGGQGKVLVDLKLIGEEVRCGITDNGHFAPNIVAGRGLSIVRSLATDLDGEIQVCFGPDGTCVQLTCPVNCPTSSS